MIEDRIVEYLRENGSANMSELCRELKCGRQTIYDAVRSLEDDGKVKSNLIRGKRVVTLRESIPSYLKILTVFTAFSIVLFKLEYPFHSFITVNLDSSNTVVMYPSFSIIILSMLSGFWTAVFILRQDDIVESIYALKRFYNAFISALKS
jgi:biotin operon repressor